MLEQFSEVLYFVKGIVRNKWIITIVACVICIGGWIFVSRMPDIYESSARVHVDTRTMLRPLLRGMAVQTDVRGLVKIMQKLMFTQYNLIQVAEMAGMEVDKTSESVVHSLVLELKEKIKIEGGRDEIFTITYSSIDSQSAKSVVQAVLSVFSEQTQQTSLGDVKSATRFIDNQIRDYEQRLRVAERAKEQFKRENIGMLPGQTGDGQIEVIQSIRTKIDMTKMELSELLSRKKVLQMQLSEALDSGEEWGLTEIVNSNSMEDSRITELEKRKDEILLKYTENHPSIASIDHEIQALKERKEESELLAASADNSISTSYEAMANPYVQTIKVSLNNLAVEVATLKARIYSYEVKLKKEDEQFNTRLGIETEIQNLNRDYETIKKNYLELIDRREKARMSSNIDSQVSALKFKVIDPAHAPMIPSLPNRPLLYTAVLFVGFIAGTAIALLKVFVWPTFVDAKQLKNITGLPVLGVVSNVVNEAQTNKNKKGLLSYVFVNALLLIGYSGVMFFNI